MKKTKIQVATLVLPIATAAGKRTFPVTMDNEFATCRGFYAIVNKGTDYLRLGIRSSASEDVLPPVNLQHIVVGNQTKIADRFNRETPFPAKGGTINISLENFAATAVEQNIDIIMLLDNE